MGTFDTTEHTGYERSCRGDYDSADTFWHPLRYSVTSKTIGFIGAYGEKFTEAGRDL